jgi:hypothetical protein
MLLVRASPLNHSLCFSVKKKCIWWQFETYIAHMAGGRNPWITARRTRALLVAVTAVGTMTAVLGVTTAGAADATANSSNLSDGPEDVTLTTPVAGLTTAAPATTTALTTTTPTTATPTTDRNDLSSKRNHTRHRHNRADHHRRCDHHGMRSHLRTSHYHHHTTSAHAGSKHTTTSYTGNSNDLGGKRNYIRPRHHP